MNEGLIKNWNDKVSANDWIYHLGDFAFGGLPIVLPILKRLNGIKVLIQGNHDKDMLKKAEFRECWEFITKYHELVIDDIKLVLFHYPLETWQGMYKGAYHFFGHCHSTPGIHKAGYMPNRMDVGVDGRLDCSPWEKDELLNFIQEKHNMPPISL
jgi:calcineurin-like phosphoesterase family protein